ncbi:pseudouridine synthase [Leptothoe sp. PORK10 BA2]|uniref:pseudouridine synthase n=1 Tax=Leptothoe sp. PORK10 BA2 TaxID=3110254 RepID=UPI002B206F83|nr:pseudouridine synthase [Leptothoe sp. PORK10 BA2]MEA5465523.1 pseudouridine synthase [Leptothoe sp. PORK10 BA2]
MSQPPSSPPLSSDEKLQKLLSQWGVASRRQSELLISTGRITVNGVKAHIGQRANPTVDDIRIDGRPLNPDNRPDKRYVLLNKPRGVISTCEDPQCRKTVIDLLPPELRQGDMRLHPVGRLDTDSTGALLLTNHGQLTQTLTHPRHHIAKTYRVRVEGSPANHTLEKWRHGVDLGGQMTAPAEVTMLHPKAPALLEIVLHEGRNRQIRRVAEQLGHPVLSLHRSSIGAIALGELPLGQCRELTPQELKILLDLL